MVSSSTNIQEVKQVATGCRFPQEMFLEIANHLDQSDIPSLAFASKSNYAILMPMMYRSLALYPRKKSLDCLNEIRSNPSLARHVHEITIFRNDNEVLRNWDDCIHESLITEALMPMVLMLGCLHSFIWNASEMPPEELWRTLRENCPQLQYVGSGIGREHLHEDSELFKFSNLVGFQLTTSWRPLCLVLQEDMRHVLPESLWDMLHNRCPGLQKLILGSPEFVVNTRQFDVSPLSAGDWPSLHTLWLGNTDITDEREHPVGFANFISRHHNLKNLRLFNTQCPPFDINQGSKVMLKSYSGSVRYLEKIMPHCDLEEMALFIFGSPGNNLRLIESFIQQSPSLKQLEIYDLASNSGLREDVRGKQYLRNIGALLAQCPNLEYFGLTCPANSKNSFQMKDVLLMLVHGPALKSLAITNMSRVIGKEKKMISTASRIFRKIPTLQHIRLNYAPEGMSPLVYPTRMAQSAQYEVISRGRKERPELLSCIEKPMYARGATRQDQYIHGILPSLRRLTS